MRRLNIDFVARPLWRLPVAARLRAILAVLGGLALSAAATLAWQAQQLDRQITESAQAVMLARQALLARTPPRPPLRLSAVQVAAINGAIGQLNTPWPAMLDAFESVATAEIALLQIEPDNRRRLVKGVAEAKDHRGMLDYLAALGSVAPFARAVVTRQEISDRDPNRPLRFLFEALLDDGETTATAPGGQPQERR